MSLQSMHYSSYMALCSVIAIVSTGFTLLCKVCLLNKSVRCSTVTFPHLLRQSSFIINSLRTTVIFLKLLILVQRYCIYDIVYQLHDQCSPELSRKRKFSNFLKTPSQNPSINFTTCFMKTHFLPQQISDCLNPLMQI